MPEREAEPEVGGDERVRPLARQEGRRAGDADHDRVERLVELRAAQFDRAQQRLGVRDRRRAAEDGRDRALRRHRAQHARVERRSGRRREDVAKRRARDPLERLGLVG